jgi:hypothetical protein
MALWSKKKVGTKIVNYLKDKNISYQLEEQASTIIKFELCFVESGFILYPYITIDEVNSLVTFNVNVSQVNMKNAFNVVNEINRKALFLKSYVTDDSILVLEYRFKAVDDISITLEGIINNVFSLENILEKL